MTIKGLIPSEIIENKIFLIRGQKVMLSMHLAELYGVEPRVLIQAVKRNIERFPRDFMFLLTRQEVMNLKSQIVTSSWGGVRRANPYAFTEQGVAMLSSVLRSKRAIQVNIAIMRAFVRLKQILATHKEVAQKLKEHDRRIDQHDKNIIAIFDIIKELIKPLPFSAPLKPKGPIGFKSAN